MVANVRRRQLTVWRVKNFLELIQILPEDDLGRVVEHHLRIRFVVVSQVGRIQGNASRVLYILDISNATGLQVQLC